MTQRTLATFMLALGLATLAGCSSPTVITLNDGREIQAVDTRNMTKIRASTSSSSWTAKRPASTRIRFVPLKSCNLYVDTGYRKARIDAGFFMGT